MAYDDVTTFLNLRSAPVSPESENDFHNEMYPEDSSHLAPGFFGRVKRRLSLRPRPRKISNSSLCSLDLESTTNSQRKGLNSLQYKRRRKFTSKEDEWVYREILHAVIHPLGAADHTIGLRPGDLVDHLQEVFQLDRLEHEKFISEALSSRPKHIQLSLSILEARFIVNTLPDTRQPFCMVSILNASKSSRSSPNTREKRLMSSVSLEDCDVKQTQPGKGMPDPKWNESFEMDVTEINTDELHIYIWNNLRGSSESLKSDSISPSNFRRSSSFRKSFLRKIRDPSDHSKSTCGFIGKVIIPVKNIPVSGHEKWYEISEKCLNSGKYKVIGKINLKLDLSLKNECESGSCEVNSSVDKSSIDIYYDALKQIYDSKVGFIDGCLPEKSTRMLQLYAGSRKISQLSQSILNLIALLEFSTQEDKITMENSSLTKAIDDLHMTWMTYSSRNNLIEKMPLTDTEIGMFRTAVTKYMQSILVKFHDDIPCLFPPSSSIISTLNNNVGILLMLLKLDLWDEDTSLSHLITEAFSKKLNADTNKWMDKNLLEIITPDTPDRDSVIPEITALVDLIKSTTSYCTSLGVVNSFFSNININYFKTTSFIIEDKISRAAKMLLQELDKYQVRYQKYDVNIINSSKVSLLLYFSLRKFHDVVLGHSSARETFKLSIANYQSWFEEVLVFWLQTFKSECSQRMNRALEIDKDVVLVTSSAKFSNSAVDVVSCFSIIIEEWRQIDYGEADIVAMSVTKITDLICDGARHYADKVHVILGKNCYYDKSVQDKQYDDITERVCITLNNIEHVRQYLNDLPTVLGWDLVKNMVNAKHGDKSVGQRTIKTLYRLIRSAHHDILLKSTVLVKEITERMQKELSEPMEKFTQKHPEKLSSIDSVLAYLCENTETITTRLVYTIYPVFMENLWFTVLKTFDYQLLSGQTPEYYDTMKRHLRSLSTYFVREGMTAERVDIPLCNRLRDRLSLNSQSTPELILQYYSQLADHIGTPVEYFGHVAVRLGYIEETRGKVTLIIKIIRATDLPGLDMNGLSDPYIEVSLKPNFIFGHSDICRTSIVFNTLNPEFNTTFHFPNISKSYLEEAGTVFHLCIMDHDKFGSDDFAGEVFIHLKKVAAIGVNANIDSLPVFIASLSRPVSQSGAFQVLRDRSPWDKVANSVVSKRLKFIEETSEPKECPQKKSCTFLSFIQGLFR